MYSKRLYKLVKLFPNTFTYQDAAAIWKRSQHDVELAQMNLLMRCQVKISVGGLLSPR